MKTMLEDSNPVRVARVLALAAERLGGPIVSIRCMVGNLAWIDLAPVRTYGVHFDQILVAKR